MGREVLARFGDLASLARANLTELSEVRGLDMASGARIVAALELGRRLAAVPASEATQIRSPSDAANLLLPTMSLLEQEVVRVLVLDTRSRGVSPGQDASTPAQTLPAARCASPSQAPTGF